MTWDPEGGHGQQPQAPPPVETYGQGLPKDPPQSMIQPLGSPALALTREDMEKAMETARRIRQLKIDALSMALQNEAREDAVTKLKRGNGGPYFSEWFLHDLWAITGGGRLSCIQPPTRHALEGGHYYYACAWRAEHRWFGSVDGFGIASTRDPFLGENEKEDDEGKVTGRSLEDVSPHNLAQHASTRAKRNALEELLGTQGWNWELLRRLRAGQSVNLKDLQAEGTPPPQGPAPAAAPPPPAPLVVSKAILPGVPPAPAAQPPATPPPAAVAFRLETVTKEQAKGMTAPAGFPRAPGPPPGKDAAGTREPVMAYLGRLVQSGAVAPDELLAHAKLRMAFKGAGIQAAPPEVQEGVAMACATDLSWVKAAKPLVGILGAASVEDSIPF